MNRHMRATILMLKILGIVLLVFTGLNIVRCLLGIFTDGNVIAYMGTLIKSAVGVLVGVGMLIASGAIKKKITDNIFEMLE